MAKHVIIYPAIDLRRGRCVRLLQGRKDQETIYGDDPAHIARRWAEEGAEWLHVVDLDGAFGDIESPNLEALACIVRAVDLPIQFGGGLRSWADIERAFSLGVTRVVLGTAALEDADLLAWALAEFGAERVAVGIDAREGVVVTHGWRRTSALSAVELGQRVYALGVRRVVHTDVMRDGTLGGANVAASVALACQTGLSVIVSGGITRTEEIRYIRQQSRQGLEGAIIGRALYTGDLPLREAIAAGKEGDEC